jgi:hypothetical protein
MREGVDVGGARGARRAKSGMGRRIGHGEFVFPGRTVRPRDGESGP